MRAPRIRTKNLISLVGVSMSLFSRRDQVADLYSIIFCEVVGIYGVIGAIVFSSRISGQLNYDDLYTKANYFTGECEGEQ